jgi:hydroxymethylglutaryl-CoA lyase
MTKLPSEVTLVEVGPRDGLQSVAETIDVEAKVRFVDGLAEAGLPVVEVGAFVRPDAVPQMAGSAEVFAGIRRRPGVRYAALVPNRRGLDAAVAAGADEVAVFTAASETFNARNIRASIAESLARIAPVVQAAAARNMRVRGYVSCALGCTYEGEVAPGKVAEVAAELLAMGVAEVSIGDTIGVGTPAGVARLLDALLARAREDQLAMHFHDTWGMAVANVCLALERGIATFDSSAGGLGGCPFAPGAAGNVATEDLVYLLAGMGVQTGVDLQRVIAASRAMEQALGRPLPSRVLRASLARRS